MPKYVLLGTYCEDALRKRKPFRAEHLERLARLKQEGKVITMGPTRDLKMVFGILETSSQDEARRLIEEDVYWREGIWTDFELHEWVQAL